MLGVLAIITVCTIIVEPTYGQECDGQLLAPCWSDYKSDVRCDSPSITAYSLVETFERYARAKKDSSCPSKFDYLRIRSPALRELPARAFAGIQFKYITIEDTYALRHINTQAFAGTESTLQYLDISNAPVLDPFAGPHHQPFGPDNQLKRVERITIRNTSLLYIPRAGFQGLPSLRELCLDKNRLVRIGPKAFADLPNIDILDLSQNQLQTVSTGSFDLNLGPPRPLNRSNLYEINSLYLRLYANQWTDDSFVDQAFIGDNQRPTIISLGDNSMTHLSMRTFQPFLLANPLNRVGEKIDCQSCDNYWLVGSDLTRNNTQFIECVDGSPLRDSSNFYQC